jgi:hypothetical protein
MILKQKSGGSCVQYELVENVLCFRNGELKVDLAGLEENHPVHIDICEDANGRLVRGPSYRYIAEIDIPAREVSVRKSGKTDDMGIPEVIKTIVPFDSNKAVLTLWPTEGKES